MDPCEGKIVCFHALSLRHFSKNYRAYQQWHSKRVAFNLAFPILLGMIISGSIGLLIGLITIKYGY